ncbi:phage tail spike protein [Abyssisolibacter fermentans]|uniref:phage tail spike protein n=1 Tax=Abyssisolibacter fermentans TaxID=1766203 RepID=UPI000830F7C0|nr:phage tail spike protein [Abyssisolibacter fermentans]
MNYPMIKNKDGKMLAVLNNVIKNAIKERINGKYTYSFTCIIEELKTDYIEYGNQIEINNQLFNIMTYTKRRTNSNKLVCSVYCEQVAYELLDHMSLFNYSNITAEQAMQNLLLDTSSFTVGHVDYLEKHTFQRDEKEANKKALLLDIAQAYNAELYFNKYEISLYSQIGANNGVQIRVGKNLKGITKTVDGTKKDIDGKPSIIYEINIFELVETEEYTDYIELETIRLGDTVHVIDEGLNIDIAARVLEYEYNPIKNINSKIVLGNFVENIATYNVEVKRQIDVVKKYKDIWNRAKIINPNKTISTEILEGSINTLNNEILAGLGSVRITENNGIMVTDNPDEAQATKALRLLGGTLALSNEKDQSNNWIWRSFGTGDGFVADEIISGQIWTSMINIVGNVQQPNAFKWDANGIKVHKIKEDNNIDFNQFILLDNKGLKFTKDGGNNFELSMTFAGGLKIGKHSIEGLETELNNINEIASNAQNTASTANINAQAAQTKANEANTKASEAYEKAEDALQEGIQYNNVSITTNKGVVATHGDGSETILDGDGFKRRIISNGNVYNYVNLQNAGTYTTTGSYSKSDSNISPISQSSLDSRGVGVNWITIPNPDFKGRHFIVILAILGIGEIFTGFSGGGSYSTWNFFLETNLKVLEYDYSNGKFKVRARIKDSRTERGRLKYERWRGMPISYYVYATD